MKKFSCKCTHAANYEWLHLANYGTFPHPYGQQLITKEAALQLAKQFKSLLVRFGWRPIPVYVGHPDDPNFSHLPEHMNSTPYGRVSALKVNGDGLWVQILWTDEGLRLFQEGRYHYLSPRWLMRPLERNLFTPVRLLSVGLTNQPNLPVQAIRSTQHSSVPILTELYGSRSEKQAILQKIRQIQKRMAETGESYPEAWHYVYQKASV